jgi:hypothetical protein
MGHQRAGWPGSEQTAAAEIEVVFRRAAADLDALHAGWAVIGGLAVSVRSRPRPAHDVDFAVSVATDGEAEAIISMLKDRGYIDAMRLETPVGAVSRLAMVRLLHIVPEDSEIYVDLLFARFGIEDLIVQHAARAEVLPGCAAPVASVGHLIAMKLLSAGESRPQDQLDLSALLAAAGPADVAQARDAAAVITARGFSQGRALHRDLEYQICDYLSKDQKQVSRPQ